MKKLILLSLAVCGLIAAPAAQANSSKRHVCHGFHYRGAVVHDVGARDVSCKKAVKLAKRYYDIVTPSKHSGFRVSGPWKGYPGPMGGPMIRKGARGVIKIHGPAYRPSRSHSGTGGTGGTGGGGTPPPPPPPPLEPQCSVRVDPLQDVFIPRGNTTDETHGDTYGVRITSHITCTKTTQLIGVNLFDFPGELWACTMLTWGSRCRQAKRSQFSTRTNAWMIHRIRARTTFRPI